MGQSASSTRCPDARVSQPSQPPTSFNSPMASLSSQVDASHAAEVNNNPITTSRRRSFSPDPDSIDSRRSARIRRRLSRFVSPHMTMNYAIEREARQSTDSSILPRDSDADTALPSTPSRVRLPRIRTRFLQQSRSPAINNEEIDSRELNEVNAPLHSSISTASPPLYQSLETPDGNEQTNEQSFSGSHFTRERSRSSSFLDFQTNNGTSQPPANSLMQSQQSEMRPELGSLNATISDILENASSPEPLLPPSGRSRHSTSRSLRELRDNFPTGPTRLGQYGEDQATVLSRLLSVAAAATAASLVGNNDQALSDARDVAGESVDGSFESFLHALQNGRLASALRNGGSENGASDGDVSEDPISNGSMGPLNFFRMFRFGSSSHNNGESASPDTSRMIPVIIVGIRSVTPRDGSIRDGRPSPPFLEALSNTPPLSDLESAATNHEPLGNLRPVNSLAPLHAEDVDATQSSHTEFNQRIRRRDRPTGFSSTPSTSSEASSSSSSGSAFPRNAIPPLSGRNTNRSSRSAYGRNLPTQTSTSSPFTSPPSLFEDGRLSDSSSFSSVVNRASDSNETPSSIQPQLSDDFQEENSPPSPITSANSDSLRSSADGTRSWIIYVLGGSYPENHPILTTPSLFTDTPTYEDMMLLSSLIGPVKPPVASQEDINSAGGIFTVSLEEPLERDDVQDVIQMHPGERCLVCLADFENGEKCRQLLKCQHIFHQECIDEWLTTGRNSCPLCRGKGVDETSNPHSSNTESTSPFDDEISAGQS